jgi:hypothetical protein
MTPNTQVICSMALTFGVPIVVAGWELWHLGPASWRPKPNEDASPEPPPLPDAGLPPLVRKPLPDCLIPRADWVVSRDALADSEREKILASADAV